MNNNIENIDENVDFENAFLWELFKYKDAVVQHIEWDKESIKISKLIIDDIFDVLNIENKKNKLENNRIKDWIKKIFDYWDNSHIEYKNWVIYLFKRKKIRRANWLTKERIGIINQKIDKNILILRIKDKINLQNKNNDELKILLLWGFKKYLLDIAKSEIEKLLNNDNNIKEWEIQWISQVFYRNYFDDLNEALALELGLLNKKDISKLYNIFWIEVLQFFNINTKKANNYINTSSTKLLEIILDKDQDNYWTIINNLFTYLNQLTRQIIAIDLKNNYNISLESNLLKIITNLILEKLNKTYWMNIFSEVYLTKINESNKLNFRKLYNLFLYINNWQKFKLTSPILSKELYREIDNDHDIIKKNFNFFSITFEKKLDLISKYNQLLKNKTIIEESNNILIYKIKILESENLNLIREINEKLDIYNAINNKIETISLDINNYNSKDNVIKNWIFKWQKIFKKPKFLDSKLKTMELDLVKAIEEKKISSKLFDEIYILKNKLNTNKTNIARKKKNIKPIQSTIEKINTFEILIEENVNTINEITKDLTNLFLIVWIKK